METIQAKDLKQGCMININGSIYMVMILYRTFNGRVTFHTDDGLHRTFPEYWLFKTTK